jgi:DNA-binding winged helix-turn-helix (wHTH) protein
MRFQFGHFTLDTARRELRAAHTPVDIEPQVFDLLSLLIAHRDRVVSRDDLIEQVWGGRIVSDSTIATRVNAARRAIADDGTAQRWIKTVARKGFRFVGEVQKASTTEPAGRAAYSPDLPDQEIGFCRTSDGVHLAYAGVGSGPILMKTANWLNHLEYDWQSPVWSPFYGRLARQFRFIRYDGRGNGLSDRDVATVSPDSFLTDLEAVVDSLKLKRFALLGMSQGAAAAIRFAVRYPQRVSRLILYGAYAQGRTRRGSSADEAAAETLLAMMRQGWGQEELCGILGDEV